MAKRVPVTFKGILPDLFKEGKGVVAQGQLGANGAFLASEVLAKHDENYMPPEAADALCQGQDRRGAEQRHSGRQSTLGAHMIPEIGHYALILALCVAVVQGACPSMALPWETRR